MKKNLLIAAAALMAASTLSAATIEGKKVAVYIDGASVGAVANNQETRSRPVAPQ